MRRSPKAETKYRSKFLPSPVVGIPLPIAVEKRYSDVKRIQPAIIFPTPSGWSSFVPPNEGDLALPNILFLTRGKISFIFAVQDVSGEGANRNNSNRLVWSAARYASVWGLPLRKLATANTWQVFESQRRLQQSTMLVMSGASAQYEFCCTAKIASGDSASMVYAAIASVFAGTTCGGRRVFDGLPAVSFDFSPIPPMVDGHQWIVGDKKLLLPSGWMASDMIQPGVLVMGNQNQLLPHLELQRSTGTSESSTDLTFLWCDASLHHHPAAMQAVQAWTHRSVAWAQTPGYRVHPISNGLRSLGPLVGTLKSVESLHKYRGDWFFRSNRLALFAFGYMPTASDAGMMRGAVESIVSQLA